MTTTETAGAVRPDAAHCPAAAGRGASDASPGPAGSVACAADGRCCSTFILLIVDTFARYGSLSSALRVLEDPGAVDDEPERRGQHDGQHLGDVRPERAAHPEAVVAEIEQRALHEDAEPAEREEEGDLAAGA